MEVERYYKDASFAPARWYGVTPDGEGVRIAYRASSLVVTRGSVPLRNHPDSTVVLEIEHETDGSMSRLDREDLRDILAKHGINLNADGRLLSPDDEIQAVMESVDEYVRNLD